MFGTPWSIDEIETLRSLIAGGSTRLAAAKALNRTEASVCAKLADIRGIGYRKTRRSQAPDAPIGGEHARIDSDCHKHLSLILMAHKAGFPVCGGAR